MGTLGENLLFNARVDKGKKGKLAVVMPDGAKQMRPTALACKGEITLVESVQVPDVGSIQVPPFSPVKQPDTFVRRHPFYGIVKEEKSGFESSDQVLLSPKLPRRNQRKRKRNRKLKASNLVIREHISN